MDQNVLGPSIMGLPVHALDNVTLPTISGLTDDVTERYYYHLDDQHSAVALTNETGDIVEAYEYTPYGGVQFRRPGSDGVIHCICHRLRAPSGGT